jgi:hypothetical protein
VSKSDFQYYLINYFALNCPHSHVGAIFQWLIYNWLFLLAVDDAQYFLHIPSAFEWTATEKIVQQSCLWDKDSDYSCKLMKMRMVINPHLSKRFDEKVAEFAQEQVSALH